LLSCFGITQAQFEGGKCLPSFLNFCQTYTEEDISGKIICCVDYDPGTFANGNELSTGQAKSLALMLIQDPSDLQLLRNKLNWIITNKGIIQIFFCKNQWCLQFCDKSKKVYTRDGARVFTLRNKK
jgi:hypothetical protein